MVAVEVEAPPSICFSIWNDWNRLVDFLDLISQIGLDPSQPDVALIQCYYRWAMLPLLEIVFLTVKTNVEENSLIQFALVEGMPGVGEVKFVASEKPGSTCVIFKLQHQMPELLLDLKVGPTSIEWNMREILSENMAEFKRLAEALAKDPSNAPSRPEAEEEEIHIGIPSYILEAGDMDEYQGGDEDEDEDAYNDEDESDSVDSSATSSEDDGVYSGGQFTGLPTSASDPLEMDTSREADEKINEKYEVKDDAKPANRTRSKSSKSEARDESRDEDKPLVSSTKSKRVVEEVQAKAAGRRKK